MTDKIKWDVLIFEISLGVVAGVIGAIITGTAREYFNDYFPGVFGIMFQILILISWTSLVYRVYRWLKDRPWYGYSRKEII
jgi:hypothetical protein